MSEDWGEAFRRAFATVKESFERSSPFPVKDETELPPNVATLWRTVHALPCAVKVANLKVDPSRYESVTDDTCQLIRYDFSRLGDDSIEYTGEVNVADTVRLEDLLVSRLDFSLQNAKSLTEEISRDFRTRGFWDDEKPQLYYHITSYDIRTNFENLVQEIHLLFRVPFLPEGVFEKLRAREIDFNGLYNLQPDHVSSTEENIDAARKRVYPRVSFEDLQKDIAEIQLIPDVPEDVQRVFKSAKDLHMFGYFRYHFFTISQHYAFLALESAIKRRYAESLRARAILRNEKGETFEMLNPTYRDIEDFCYRKKRAGWNARRLIVNGEEFPYSGQKLLDWLVHRGLITKWERYLYDAGLYLRNSLSHLERASIFPPGPMILRRLAYQINKLSHQVASSNG